MAKVLFLNVPSHGHVNPTIGLVNELVKQGEEVIYFSSDEFKEKIEFTGAVYKSYNEDLNIFKVGEGLLSSTARLMKASTRIIDDILFQTRETTFDYLIFSTPFPFARVMAQILNIPTVSSLGIYVGLKDFMDENATAKSGFMKKMPPELLNIYKNGSQHIYETYGARMPDKILHMLFNKGDINLVYTSTYFIPDIEYLDDSFKFVGPPVSERKENLDFPFEKLIGKKVIYISLGTVFSNYDKTVYDIFFKSFAGMDAVVVMAAHNVDLSQVEIPENFIVRNYVPQSEILKYTAVAITHAGMNSISDILYNEVPFVAIPLGADQPELARRAAELGATISLDINKLTPEILKNAVGRVTTNPRYARNIKKISESFKEAGGYPKAVQEIFRMKKEKNIVN